MHSIVVRTSPANIAESPPTMLQRRPLIVLLLVLNSVVLLGQLWPEGAPPFARVVNVAFLVLSLGYFVTALRRAGRDAG